MKASIIIPCHFSHFHFLEPLLSEFEKQTILPDEVIISLSECGKISQKELEDFKEKKWMFNTELVLNTEKKTAGENRNIASEKASGDIFIYQDADDIPHCQRVEVIKHFFLNYQVDALYHKYSLSKEPMVERIKINALSFFYPNGIEHISIKRIHLGNLAVKKALYHETPWPLTFRGQDALLQLHLFDKKKKILAIDASLIKYRKEHSTFLGNKKYFSESEIKNALKELNSIARKRKEIIGQNACLGLNWFKKYYGSYTK